MSLSLTVLLTNVDNVNDPLLTLANRNNPICVALPKVAKASTVVTVVCHCRPQFCFTNFDSVNDPLI